MNTRIEGFSFKRKGFVIEDIVIEKIEPALNMLSILDDMLLEDVKPGDIEGEKALTLYFEIRGKLEDVAEILNNLDQECYAGGFYKRGKGNDKKKALAAA